MKIIVDAMGGDNAPDEIVKGAMEAAASLNCKIIMTGNKEKIDRVINNYKGNIDSVSDKIEIINTTQVIDIEDDPATVIRQKKDSSLVVALNLLRDGKGDAVVSAGSTGALLSGATLIVKRIRGIRRAALAPLIPNSKSGFILIDCGANSDCTAEFLLQFAYMGSYYAQDMLSIDNPRVGLLNNGSEHTKGTALQIETYKLLENAAEKERLNFIGNIEPSNALKGACDVLVCDGYSGNIFLKSIEGTASLIMGELKTAFYTNAFTKISALLVKKQLSEIKEKMNPDNVGGTALLGISKPVIKAHGSSKSTAITAAIRQAITSVNVNTESRLIENIDKMKLM